jgi:hypothetical protein
MGNVVCGLMSHDHALPLQRKFRMMYQKNPVSVGIG